MNTENITRALYRLILLGSLVVIAACVWRVWPLVAWGRGW